jgi:xylose dehydrogenase (NAD/NADP)
MTIRWGFLGAGFVASKAMAPAVHAAQGAFLAGVASRDTQRSGTLQPEKVHGSYEDLLDDDNIDAVYISLANSQHYEWVIRALQAGKNVLCEKPLALTAVEAHHMYAVATEQKRLLVEAVWVAWHPRFRRMVEVANSGMLGEISSIATRFTSMSTMSDNYRLVPEMGGGALLDVGCYQAYAWQALGGADNASTEVTSASCERGPSGVDMTTRAIASLGGRIDASMICSFSMESGQEISVAGSHGEMRVGKSEAFTSWREESSLHIGDTEEFFPAVDAFEVMVEEVSKVFAGNDGWVVQPDASLRVARIVDDIALRTAAL